MLPTLSLGSSNWKYSPKSYLLDGELPVLVADACFFAHLGERVRDTPKLS